jgi:phosphatidylglycerophosphate synthase
MPAVTRMSDSLPSRRPIAARDTAWASAIARCLARSGLRPNTISVLSSVFAAGAGAGFWAAGRADGTWAWVGCLIGAVAGMQLRLLCNLFDGMVAIEGGFKTKSGEVFNELPDRFSDAFILVGAGYAVGTDFPFMPELGWLAAVLAVATPMAKQQRMATLTAAAVIALGAP